MLPNGIIAAIQERHAWPRDSVISRGFSLSAERGRRGIRFAFVNVVFIFRLTWCAHSGAVTVNQRLIAEFTALVAAQAPLIIEGTMPLAEGPLWVYWQHSKTLWPRRKRELEELSSLPDSGSPPDRSSEIREIAGDLLVGEMWTRVAGAVLTACDRRQRLQRAEPIARNVLAVHQQCRSAVLRMLLHSTVLPADQLGELDRLRRRVERWTDVLLGPLIAHYGSELSDFAFDARRAREFADEQMSARFRSTSQPAWSFLLAGLRTAFPGGSSASPLNDPTLPILRSMLALFPDDAFQSSGPIQSLRHSRVVRAGQQSERPFAHSNESLQKLRRDLANSTHRQPPHRRSHDRD